MDKDKKAILKGMFIIEPERRFQIKRKIQSADKQANIIYTNTEDLVLAELKNTAFLLGNPPCIEREEITSF